MELKVGNKVVEEDGIVTLVYEIVEIKGDKAIGATKFEGKTYYTAYDVEFEDRNNIRSYKSKRDDGTIRRLPKENKKTRHGKHSEKSERDR